MRKSVLTILFFLNAAFCYGQVSLEKIALDNGTYAVGFKHYIVTDSTRTYTIAWNEQTVLRKIPISIWYPSGDDLSGEKPLLVLDYMEILKEEREWEYLPNEQILNWFYYQNTPKNQSHLTERTTAYSNISSTSEQFPAIVYAPSYQASSIENFALCEFLASHGYVVISSPSIGTESLFLEGGTEKDMETQERDLEFLVREIMKRQDINSKKIATMGFSFGGLSNVLLQMKNDLIKAIVSLDGSIKYQYPTLQKSPFAAIEKVDVPFIHMAQKDIPKEVIKEDNVDITLNNNFDFYDDLIYSDAYRLKFNDLTHSYFSTLGILFAQRDPRQDKSDTKIMESYKWVATYTLNFLDAFLKDETDAQAFLKREPKKNKVREGLISKTIKPAQNKAFSFKRFTMMAVDQNYKNLDELYHTIQNKHPSYKPQDGKLNGLGLHLLYNPETSEQGIKVLLFATKTYPESANLFDSLAEAYLFVGNNAKAIENFERSLELNPQNQNAINKLEKLKN